MKTNYIDEIAAEIGEHCGFDSSMPLLRTYALLALVFSRSGEDVTNEDVHDAWSAWRSETGPDHPSIVPFDELSREKQDLDEPYRLAIQAWIDKHGDFAGEYVEPRHHVEFQINGYTGADSFFEAIYTPARMAKRIARKAMRDGGPFAGYSPGDSDMLLSLPTGAFRIVSLRGDVEPWAGALTRVGI